VEEISKTSVKSKRLITVLESCNSGEAFRVVLDCRSWRQYVELFDWHKLSRLRFLVTIFASHLACFAFPNTCFAFLDHCDNVVPAAVKSVLHSQFVRSNHIPFNREFCKVVAVLARASFVSGG